jgi:hypothetical protein
MKQSPELLQLFTTYTGGLGSIGANLAAQTARLTAGRPLVLATSSDFVLYPGNGAAPEVVGFRLGTRGFKELAGVSHLGPAVATLLRMRQNEPGSDLWRTEAQRLLQATAAARRANSAALWRDTISVVAWQGREEAIARLTGYACRVTERYLQRVLREPDTFTPQDLREQYLEATGSAVGATVPMNRMMIATFFLVGLDIAHRVIAWFDQRDTDWGQAMALIVGKQGRPTAGVTHSTSSVAAMLFGASRGRLPRERLYIAPHSPVAIGADPLDPAKAAPLEQPLRQLWCQIRAVSELGPLMYEGYPRYAVPDNPQPVLAPGTTEVAEMPRIQGPDDWRSLNTRLRVVLEDPRQLLSGCVTDYAIEQLVAHGNDPRRVQVPGLDGTDYPD